MLLQKWFAWVRIRVRRRGSAQQRVEEKGNTAPKPETGRNAETRSASGVCFQHRGRCPGSRTDREDHATVKRRNSE
jgi:hypothetical protein